MKGEVGILNVGAGDVKLSFDPSNPAEMIRASRIVKDMIRRGYALLVGVKKEGQEELVYQRVLDFEEGTCEYIVADFDPLAAQAVDQNEAQETHVEGTGEPVEVHARGRKPNKRKIKATDAHAVAVPRSAGG